MGKDKDSLKDLYALRKQKDRVFNRPVISNKKFKKIVTGQDTSCNKYNEFIDWDNWDLNNVNDHFVDISFGEYISEKTMKTDLTLKEIVNEIDLSLESLYALLDEDILPWHIIPAKTLNQLCMLLDISKAEVIEQINSVNITENNAVNSISTNYAARSQAKISTSKLKSSLYDANVKIAIEREKEKREEYIASISK